MMPIKKNPSAKKIPAQPDAWVYHTGKFLLGLLAVFIFSNFLLSLFPLVWFERFYAAGSLFALGFFGMNGAIIAQEPVLVQLDAFALPLGFSYLCTGLLELTFVWGATLASFGVGLRKRLIGAAAGTIVLVLFNFARIILSVLIIAALGLDAGNFAHDLLFRAFLFITIAGYYYFWLRWAAGAKKPPFLK